MKPQWLIDWLEKSNFSYQYSVEGFEVWESPKKIVVLNHTGIKLFYDKSLFNEHYTRNVVDKDILILCK